MQLPTVITITITHPPTDPLPSSLRFKVSSTSHAIRQTLVACSYQHRSAHWLSWNCATDTLNHLDEDNLADLTNFELCSTSLPFHIDYQSSSPSAFSVQRTTFTRWACLFPSCSPAFLAKRRCVSTSIPLLPTTQATHRVFHWQRELPSLRLSPGASSSPSVLRLRDRLRLGAAWHAQRPSLSIASSFGPHIKMLMLCPLLITDLSCSFCHALIATLDLFNRNSHGRT